jgi:hypothetical protein
VQPLSALNRARQQADRRCTPTSETSRASPKLTHGAVLPSGLRKRPGKRIPHYFLTPLKSRTAPFEALVASAA